MDKMTEERRHQLPLSDKDVERIADAISQRATEAFHISEEKHYNSHKKLDSLLDAYDSATNIFWRTFLSLVIIGAIVLAGYTVSKGGE